MQKHGLWMFALVLGFASPAVALQWKNNALPQNKQGCPIISRVNVTVSVNQPIARPEEAEHVLGDLAEKVTQLARANNFRLGDWERKKHFSVNSHADVDANKQKITQYNLSGTLIYDDFDDVNLGNKFLELLTQNNFPATLTEYEGQSPWCLHKK